MANSSRGPGMIRHSVVVREEGSQNSQDDDSMLIRRGARLMLHSNLKIFSRAVTALSRLGSDLWLEPREEGLIIKSFNKSKSAYGQFLFLVDFFSEFDPAGLANLQQANACRISMKSALFMLRGQHVVDNNLVACQFFVDTTYDYFIMELQLAYEVRRCFNIRQLEVHMEYKTQYDKSKLQNCSVTAAESLMSTLHEIHSKSEELIICATENSFVFKNYFHKDEGNAGRKLVKTEANIPLNIFTRHSAPRSTELSISLKEFMAAVTFASHHAAPISIYYDVPGKPLVVALEGDINYTGEFVMGTVETDDMPVDERRLISTQHLTRSQATPVQSQRANTNRVGTHNGLQTAERLRSQNSLAANNDARVSQSNEGSARPPSAKQPRREPEVVEKWQPHANSRREQNQSRRDENNSRRDEVPSQGDDFLNMFAEQQVADEYDAISQNARQGMEQEQEDLAVERGGEGDMQQEAMDEGVVAEKSRPNSRDASDVDRPRGDATQRLSDLNSLQRRQLLVEGEGQVVKKLTSSVGHGSRRSQASQRIVAESSNGSQAANSRQPNLAADATQRVSQLSARQREAIQRAAPGQALSDPEGKPSAGGTQRVSQLRRENTCVFSASTEPRSDSLSIDTAARPRPEDGNVRLSQLSLQEGAAPQEAPDAAPLDDSFYTEVEPMQTGDDLPATPPPSETQLARDAELERLREREGSADSGPLLLDEPQAADDPGEAGERRKREEFRRWFLSVGQPTQDRRRPLTDMTVLAPDSDTEEDERMGE